MYIRMFFASVLLGSWAAYSQGIEFGRGPFVCKANDPTITKAQIANCAFRNSTRDMSGSCVALLESQKEIRAYSVALVLDYMETRSRSGWASLSFTHTYDNVHCEAKVQNMSRIENCHEYNYGASRQCTVCFSEGMFDRCYYAHLAFDRETMRKYEKSKSEE